MGMLYGRVGITAGSLRVAGLDVARQGAAVRRLTGVVPQDDTTDHDLDVEGNLLSYARYFGLRGRPARERAEELLDFFQLAERRHARIDDLSGGLKRRVTIASSCWTSRRPASTRRRARRSGSGCGRSAGAA
jgi:lipooligosaccharide transport system ATP-binding protein